MADSGGREPGTDHPDDDGYEPPTLHRLGTLEELNPEEPDDGLGIAGDGLEGYV